MKKIIYLFVIAMLVSGCVTIPTPTIKSTSKVKFESLGVVAVFPFQGFRGEQFADTVTQELLMRGVKIVERTRVTSVLLEQGLNIADITEGKINYTKLGGLLGVDAIVIGSVSPITVYSSGAPSEKVSSASMRLVSVKTGVVIGASSYSANTEYLVGSALYPDVAEKLVKSLIE